MLLLPRTEVVTATHGPDRLVGDLTLPVARGAHPLVVTVFGSGPGGRYAYDWPQRFAAAGFAFYSYDRPGCGESTGDWRAMDFTARAAETRAVVATLARHPEVDPDRIALFGGSQGGWIAPLAAAGPAPSPGPVRSVGSVSSVGSVPHAGSAPGGERTTVAAVVTFSGPAVSPAVQERYRMANVLREAGLTADEVAAGMAVVDRTQDQLRSGRPAGEILRQVRGHQGAAWLPHLLEEGDNSVEDLDFLRRILDHDPVPVLRAIRCPYLALFGARDQLVPVDESVRVIGQTLAEAGHPDHTVVVFPDADHGIRPIGWRPSPSAVPPRAPGFFELIIAWLTRRLGATRPAG